MGDSLFNGVRCWRRELSLAGSENEGPFFAASVPQTLADGPLHTLHCTPARA